MNITGMPQIVISQVVDALIHLPQDITYDVEIKEHKSKRSLDANAYFHILVSKLANTMHIDAERVKQMMVVDYCEGTYIRLPQGEYPSKFGIKYYKEIGQAVGTKKPCTDYLVFKPTHELDSKEMSNLIEGTIEECKQVGIPSTELMTPAELANLRGIK